MTRSWLFNYRSGCFANAIFVLEEKSLQEAADKERINELEVENRRLKAYEDSVTEIQLKFYELKYLLENERKVIDYSPIITSIYGA